MTRTATKLAAATATVAALFACEPVATDAIVPSLADVSPEADAAVDLIDREQVLAEAVDAELASPGAAFDPRLAGEGFRLQFSGEGVVDTSGAGTERDAMPTYANVWAGASAVAWAEGIRHAVVGPQAIAIAVALDGRITQVQPNVWLAENTVHLPEGPITTHLTAAWVGVGWLAEMRVSDGARDHALWFNGFLGAEGRVGWWDLYEGADVLAVVEWIADGEGHGQFGIAAVGGDAAGAWLQYAFTEDFNRIDAFDPATGEQAWVMAYPDDTGEVRLPDFNGGLPACWGTDLRDAACPADEPAAE
jgi:hypothetical protein